MSVRLKKNPQINVLLEQLNCSHIKLKEKKSFTQAWEPNLFWSTVEQFKIGHGIHSAVQMPIADISDRLVNKQPVALTASSQTYIL